MVVQDIRTWDRPGEDPMNREIRYVNRVRSALGVDQKLCAPPRASEHDGVTAGWIPALRFPTWMRCRSCGLLHRAPWRHQEGTIDLGKRREGSGVGCSHCDGWLEQWPWVMVHEEGYLADVPWHHVAHRESRNLTQSQCRADWTGSYLRLDENNSDWRIHCTRCGANDTLRTGALPRLPYPPGTWQQPWVREPPDQVPDIPALVVEINDVRVHAPRTRSALVIPPESRIRRGTVTDRLFSSTQSQESIRNARDELLRQSRIRTLASEFRCAPSEIEEAIADIERGYPLYGQAITPDDLLADEYRALIEEIPDVRDNEDFVTVHHTENWNAYRGKLDSETVQRAAATVSNLVAVNRLKEILVMTGFQRGGGKRTTPPDITGVSPWYPALELYGEGIFFRLDENELHRFERRESLQERASAFEQRYRARQGIGNHQFEPEVSPRFLLCHTLSHLMIREIEAHGGYPAASIKERIYCRTGEDPMAGILLYVAVPDEEGSLGGLMELAKPETFLRLLTGAFDAARWCSLDPVCGEQEGHGPDLLNRAACHACALVPETSCPYGNILLDRVFVNAAVSNTAVPRGTESSVL